MSVQYPGGYITKTPPIPDGTTAVGMWTLSQQADYQKLGLWPAPIIPIDLALAYTTSTYDEYYPGITTNTADAYYPYIQVVNSDVTIEEWSDDESLYVVPGTYSWVAPAGVTSVCVACLGGGGGGMKAGSNGATANGGGGAGLGYINNYTVTPGSSYTVSVGRGGYAYAPYSGSATPTDGTDSYFVSTAVCKGGKGYSGVTRTGGNYVGDGGGNGGTGGNSGGYPAGGGGAGGYSGNGGNGGSSASSGSNGSGGGGGGGGSGTLTYGGWGGSGGGVWWYGEGASGSGGNPGSYGDHATGGSGGATGNYGNGGVTVFGAGGGAGASARSAAYGGNGWVRIIWGAGRSFPSTNTTMNLKTSHAEVIAMGMPYDPASSGGTTTLSQNFVVSDVLPWMTRSYFYATTNTYYDTINELASGGMYVTSQGLVSGGSAFPDAATGTYGDVTGIMNIFKQDQDNRWMQLVTYTGDGTSSQTISHDLGSAPAMMVVLPQTTNMSKYTYHKDMSANPETEYMLLDTDAAPVTASSTWNDTAPTSSEFTVGSSYNSSGVVYRMWLIADIPGKVKVGSYTGNGSNQTISTGLVGAVRSLWIKKVGTGSWWMWNGEVGIPSSGNDLTMAIDLNTGWVSGSQNVNSSGNDFVVYENATTAINTSSAEYIYFAIGT